MRATPRSMPDDIGDDFLDGQKLKIPSPKYLLCLLDARFRVACSERVVADRCWRPGRFYTTAEIIALPASATYAFGLTPASIGRPGEP